MERSGNRLHPAATATAGRPGRPLIFADKPPGSANGGRQPTPAEWSAQMTAIRCP